MVTGVLSAEEASATINPGESTIALFFGGMVVARTLTPTGLFDYLGGVTIRFVHGDGRRLMLVIVVIAAPICAALPNATVVMREAVRVHGDALEIDQVLTQGTLDGGAGLPLIEVIAWS